MNSPLEQLASRSLDSVPLAIRPRQLSRFESNAHAQAEIDTDMTVESPSLITPDAFSQDAQTVQPVQSPSGSVEQPRFGLHAPPDSESIPTTGTPQSDLVQTTCIASPLPRSIDQNSSDDRADSLTRRLDQLDRQLKNLSPRDESSRPLSAPLPEVTTEPAEPAFREETHHHYQHTSESNYHSQIIEHRNEPTVLVPPSEQRSPQDRTTPNIVAEDNSLRTTQIEQQGITPQTIQSRDQPKVQIPPPHVIVQPTVPAPPMKASGRAERPNPVPQIIVEKNDGTEPASHTVTVSIGRIEVRAPQKPATPATNKPNRPSARIMSLDDYMRRRAGGVG